MWHKGLDAQVGEDDVQLTLVIVLRDGHVVRADIRVRLVHVKVGNQILEKVGDQFRCKHNTMLAIIHSLKGISTYSC